VKFVPDLAEKDIPNPEKKQIKSAIAEKKMRLKEMLAVAKMH